MVYLENKELVLSVKTFFECRDSKIFPAPGSMMHQTSYCLNLFSFLDSLVQENINKKEKEYKRDMEKRQKELKAMSKTPRKASRPSFRRR